MDKKELKEQEINKVSGGSPVLPLRSSEAPEVDGAALVGVSRIKLCSACDKPLECPPTGHGTITCSCGTVNRY